MNSSRLKWYSETIMNRDLLYKTICPLSGNIHTIPKIVNISLNMSSSLTSSQSQTSASLDRVSVGAKGRLTQILSGLEILSCQKVKKTYALKSIASFKLRKNQCIGGMVTLRNESMYYFFEKFCYIVLPKMREFQTLALNQNTKNASFSSIDFSGGAFLLYPELSNQYEIFEAIKGFNVSVLIRKKEKQTPIFLHQRSEPGSRSSILEITGPHERREKIVLSFFIP